MSLVALRKACEIIPERLFFLSTAKEVHPCSTLVIVNVDHDLLYEGFYGDFGPLNISCIYKYCQRINKKIKICAANSKIVVHLTSINARKRVNSALLMGCFLIAYMKFTPEEALKALTQTDIKYIAFRDASVGRSTFQLSLINCLKGFCKALESKVFKIQQFNIKEYDHYSAINNGDLHWIIFKKILAFTGPTYKTQKLQGYLYHSPKMYISVFHKWNVSAVIRLNPPEYDAASFTNAGIEHYNLIFEDGGVPTENIVHKFLKIVENSTGAVAVHCKAGLGRTGTLIACYLMKHYHFTSGEAIAWIRMCRSGSVIGRQQNWLVDHQNWCWKLNHSNRPETKKTKVFKNGDSRNKYILTQNEQIPKLIKPIIKRQENSQQLEEHRPQQQGEILNSIKSFNKSQSRRSSKSRRVVNSDTIPSIICNYEIFPKFGRNNLHYFHNKPQSQIKSVDDSGLICVGGKWTNIHNQSLKHSHKEIIPELVDHTDLSIIPSYNVTCGDTFKN